MKLILVTSIMLFSLSSLAGEYCHDGKTPHHPSSGMCKGKKLNWCKSKTRGYYECGGENIVPNNKQKTAKPQIDFSSDFVPRFIRSSVGSADRGKKKNRYQVFRWPSKKTPSGDTILACGAKHIRAYRSKAYMHPISACMLAGVAQEWRQTMCPDNHHSCQLLFGDMTYAHKKPKEWPHRSHRKGYCIDIWPVRTPNTPKSFNVDDADSDGILDDNDKDDDGDGHVDGEGKQKDKLDRNGVVRFGLGYEYTTENYEKQGERKLVHHKYYDSERTIALIKLMSKWGADSKEVRKRQFFFNDPKAIKDNLSRYLYNHYDHIHVCFRPNAENINRCKALKINYLTCPSLRGEQDKLQLRLNDSGTVVPIDY